MHQHQGATGLAPFIAKQLHSNVPAIYDGMGKEYKVRSMAQGAVRGLDIGNYRFITQNPNKGSRWAKMAQAGHQITWLIHQPSNKWIARIVDGKVELL